MSILIVAAACNVQTAAPPNPDQGNSAGMLGVVAVTVSGIESGGTPSATAQWVGYAGGDLRPQAVNVVAALPQVSTRVVQVLDTTSTPTSPTIRSLTAVLDIINTTNTTFNNLTFYALNDPARSVGGTALTSILAGNGSPVSDPAVARSFVPSHGMYNAGWVSYVSLANANLGFLTRDEVASIRTQLTTLGVPTEVEPLQYGFIARNSRGGLTPAQKRVIGARGCTPSSCDRGYMALAFNYPRSASRAESPDTFTLLFAVGYDDAPTFSQSLEEQRSATVAGQPFSGPEVVAAQSIRTLTGTNYSGDNHLPLCRIVTAGSLAAPLAWMGSLPAGQTGCTVLQPRNFTSNNLTPSSAQLGWLGPAGATSYTLERGSGNSPTSWTPITLSSPTANSITDSGLTPSTLYTYRLRANSPEGSSIWLTLAVTTPSGAPGTPASFSFSNLSHSSVTLSWSGVANATGYALERGLGGSPSTWNPVPLSPANATSVSLTDLIPNTLYTLRLRATNALGNSSWVNLSLTTSAAAVPYCFERISADTSSIVGYSDKISYLPGETLELKVNSPTGNFALAVYREGSQSTLAHLSQLRLFVDGIAGAAQSVPAKPYETGVNWPTAYRITIPAEWPGGLYNFKLIERNPPAGRDAYCSSVPVVVKRSPTAATPQPPIVVMAGNYTWQAYNNWGGASLYQCASNTCGGASVSYILSSQRPMPVSLALTSRNEHYAFGTVVMLRWLESQGYSYDVISNTDLDRDRNALSGYRVMILDRHDEYYTTSMRDRVDEFLRAGNSVVNLGANQMYWKVVSRGEQIEVRKDFSSHTLSTTPESGGLWRNLGRPEAAVLGVQFTDVDFGTYAPFVVQNASHWTLAGTGLTNGSTFGATGNAGQGCSGWELDKVAASTPASTELIARGSNPYAAGRTTGDRGGFMVYIAHPTGGRVFSGGSLSYISCLATDGTISRITRNVLTRFLGP
ncbi:MAG: fibronectin type III domain-containing protein [Meiothermus sp.]|nr:fibronectin type III domain-containing protein [Meiothermus sp.]